MLLRGQIILFSVSFLAVFGQNEDIFCSEEFCKKYVNDKQTKCPPLPENCQIQNSTHNGLFLPFPGPCNCCKHCLVNIHENKPCAVGDPSSPTPSSICGDGLVCDAKKGTTCQRIKTPCTRAQDLYDEKRQKGTLGHLEVRPKCDRNGLFAPYACVPGEICFCVSEDGERIFGEIPYTQSPDLLMQCKCPRYHRSAVKFLGEKLHASEHLRCKSNGDYDKVQCIGDKCLCVDEIEGKPAFKDTVLVNMTSINNETLPCLKNENYTEGEYYKKCENIYVRLLKEMRGREKEGFEILSTSYPNCQIDGNYAPVQKKAKKMYCSDPDGDLLEDFSVAESDLLAKTMDCKCARVRSLIKSEEKPVCCKNGNYQAMQCRRGLCRCVNSDGVQVVKEVNYSDRETLPCFGKCTPVT